MKNVLVLFGGRSVEHDVSIITGLGVIHNISSEYNSIAVYIDKYGSWWYGEKLKNICTYKDFDLKNLKKCAILPNSKSLTIWGKLRKKEILIYCAINCLHGHDGEDGAVSGMLQIAGVPSTSQSVLSNAVCMDKTMTKTILSANKIKTVDGITLRTDVDIEWDKIEKNIGYPCIIKPNSLGSSIGVSVAKNVDECKRAIELAGKYDNEILIEKYLQGCRELNIAVMQDIGEVKTSNIEEVCLNGGVYAFGAKYKDKTIKRVVPAVLSDKLSQQIQKTAKKIYGILRCSGIVRVDFLYVDDILYINEVNTIPGSLACYLWKEPKLNYNALLTKLVENSVKRFDIMDKKVYSISTDILSKLDDNSFKMSK